MIKPFQNPYALKRRTAVTVCVAAMCDTNILLGASDRMLTSGDVEFEPESAKIYSVTNSVALMIAGDASLQMEIYRRLYAWATARITDKPTEWIPIAEMAEEYYRIYQSIRSSRAEARLLVPLGLTLDTFRAQQRSLLDSTAAELTKEIINFEMSSIEAIVAGIDLMGAHIYVVNNGGVMCQDAIGFAAIGVGYWHANSQFMFAGHNRKKPLPETFLLTYAAKRRAEVAPGVGSGTDMFTMGPNLGSFTLLMPQLIEGLEKIYRRTRTRAATSVKRSNKEVNQYVDQLGKAADAQQQKGTTTPESTDKTNGKEKTGTDGEVDGGGAPKPN